MTAPLPEFPGLSKEAIKQTILPEVFQWSLANGLIMYPAGFSPESASITPISLYPTPIRKDCFQDAIDVQKAYNKLYAKISQNSADNWLTQRMEEFADADPEFTGKLWALYLEVKKIGISQKLKLGVFRSDYLVDQKSKQIKQVEFNTVSVSFGGLSSKVGELHQFLNDTGKYSPRGLPFYLNEIPVSASSQLLADGLAAAIKKYDGSNAIVVFIVQHNERNVFDQRILEYNLFKAYNIKSIRLTIDQIHTHTKMDETSKRLFLSSTNEEIGLVYFRSGYTPNDFVTEQDWKNRLQLEVSYAIKAPDLLTQLSGAKKIQQMLTDESQLERFISDDKIRDRLMKTFVKIYPLDNTPLGIKGKKLAFESPENYVLKPQREGGGNNIYKEDIPTFLSKLKEDEWEAYILMELIDTSVHDNILIRGSEIFHEPIISELGIYGCILFDDENIYTNDYSGWLLRSKFSSSNEGGVAAGFGCVDSVVLY
ncbi:hypothetical protein TBLA_0A04700 [Henningerozyma blattae CBS 6284]|uniref:Glutathione synthetase n=1 Tax=Henningerozyma blattae (strain ATCC 34711 / CBS 6284 / DSM 70876 / NBRC 10599 / NRRL Y-10934 / UCD 77-7) TaxID=1071380 RepID=I2GVW1_HENB6|nr:hypothetical protein TBLA_0A04700 [Tetrapisispora blattae CBS 6284]CCH58263.1 hypothetical protein TBLA_0A04700 [Tetrapisispora blattae CBS 6284]